MSRGTATIRFARAGDREGQPLDKQCVYQVSVDGGPRSEFRSPWDADDLEERLRILRNTDEDRRPDVEIVRELGKELAAEMFKVKGFAACLQNSSAIYWLLDYPELARLPWELLTEDQEPFRHLLVKEDGGISFIRKVTAAIEDHKAAWPSGRDEALRMLYVWGHRQQGEVPDQEHLAVLTDTCSRIGVHLDSAEIANIADLADLCNTKSYHFVHLLAHGARTDNQQWGLRLKERVVSGEQIARALRIGGSSPALVTVAACDSAGDQNNTFGSVAYNLHVHGIPLVLASQFRLSKKVSTASIASVYEKLLGGGDMVAVLEQTRRQLSPTGTEAWANEVLYSRYRHDSLTEMSGRARQQAALRRARVINQNKDLPADEAIEALSAEVKKLRVLVKSLERADGPDREAIAETYGLIGSLLRRRATVQGLGGDTHLRSAAKEYLRGFDADRNSHYCAVNVVHLYKRLGWEEKANAFIPIVRYTVEAEIRSSTDYWAYATAGELEVYAGNADRALEHYSDFFDAVDERVIGNSMKVDTIQTPIRQLFDIEALQDEDFSDEVLAAAREAREWLEEAVRGIPDA